MPIKQGQSAAVAVATLVTFIACGLAGCGAGSPSDSHPSSSQARQLTRSVKQAASDYQNVTQALYVAYFGRPADPHGLANFETALMNAGAPADVAGLSKAYAANPAVKSLIDSFGTSQESAKLYGSGNSTAFVTAIFQNVLGRTPAADGLSFWSNAIDAGTLSQGDVALAIMAGALSNQSTQGLLDAQLINNRLTVAANFTAALSRQDVPDAYSGAVAAQSARTMLAAVTAGTDAVAYQATVQSTISSLMASAGISADPVASLAQQCAAPRPAGTIDPESKLPYGDTQGSLGTEMSWIAAYVNATYLWYADVPAMSSASYAIGNTVSYVNPYDDRSSTRTLHTNYDVVDAYFNTQRTPLFTATGKPKDQFHFTYVTSDWDSLSRSGGTSGFGFEVALLAAYPPRSAVLSLTYPGTAAAQNNLQRGARILTVNGVDLAYGNDVDTLNEGLFRPVVGKTYTFTVQDEGSSTPRTVSMAAANITLVPVQNAGTLPAPYQDVGYISFTDHIAPAESELIAAVNQLKAANGGAGIKDLVLDLRYNGGGYLDIASELDYMIAGAAATHGKVFETDHYNDKNPFGFTTAQETVPFHDLTLGFSTSSGQPLPQLNLSTVYVLTGSNTCSASEAIMNGLLGIGVRVVQIGATTCGKPYGFFPQDNCGTTYFAIQFQGENNQGFGSYADGFIPGGSGSAANNLPGCTASDDFSHQLGDPGETMLATALQYRATGSCPAASLKREQREAKPVLVRSPARENRILRRLSGGAKSGQAYRQQAPDA
ncbi:MAG TPA: DUF4214 domain-containing protein [Noviherbaspirillum sp.]